jgi:hypothetical protein
MAERGKIMKVLLSLLSFLVWIAGLWALIPIYRQLTSWHEFVGGLSTIYLAVLWFAFMVWTNYMLWEWRAKRSND